MTIFLDALAIFGCIWFAGFVLALLWEMAPFLLILASFSGGILFLIWSLDRVAHLTHLIP